MSMDVAELAELASSHCVPSKVQPNITRIRPFPTHSSPGFAQLSTLNLLSMNPDATTSTPTRPLDGTKIWGELASALTDTPIASFLVPGRITDVATTTGVQGADAIESSTSRVSVNDTATVEPITVDLPK
jgi:hypothetical protein